MPPVVFIGDDFTGASDTLATYSRAGWRTRLFLDAPSPLDCKGMDAVGIATAMRANAPEQTRELIDRLWPAINALGPSIIHLKVCSTFDSSPTVGSIGAAAAALVNHFDPDHLIVIGGQPSLGRYCIFGTLFARAGDGAIYRIDRHPVMAHHPVTPMSEADLRIMLQGQGLEALDLYRLDALTELPEGQGTRGVIDCFETDHPRQIGRALAQLKGRQLLIGASSVAEAFTQGGEEPVPLPAVEHPSNSRVLVFAGSRSSTTRMQIETAGRFTKIVVRPDDLDAPEQIMTQVSDQLAVGTPTLLFIDPDAEYGMTPEELAEASANLLAGILKDNPVGWLGIAGGDTSSRICQVLGFAAIDYVAPFSAGVGICQASHPKPELNGMRLLLKGGQMGEDHLFDDFAKAAEMPREAPAS